MDIDAESFILRFEKELINQPIKTMSNLTMHLLQSINYEEYSKNKNENFFFRQILRDKNTLEFEMRKYLSHDLSFLIENGVEIKELIENKSL